MGCGCGDKAIATPEQIAEAQRLADERRAQIYPDGPTAEEERQISAERAVANATS